VKVGRPDQRGQLCVTGLPAGRARAVAVESIQTANGTDRRAEALAATGAAVDLGGGEKTTIELKLSSVNR
jgi:hypothetical protein